MKYLFATACLFLLLGCFGGPPKQSVAVEASVKAMQAPIVHTDINGDRVVDTVVVIDNVGSQFSGKVVQISDGKRRWSAENTERDDAIVTMFYTDIADKAIVDTVRKMLLPLLIRSKLDPVGEWIIDAQKSRSKVKNNHFDFIAKPGLVWQNDMKMPTESYCVKIEPPLALGLGKLRESLEGIAVPSTLQSKNAWWVYRTNISLDEPLKEVATIDGAKIYASSAAVAIEKAGKFAWLFINDYYATGCKGTIDGVKIVENRYLIVSLNSGVPVNTYLIDTHTGAFAKSRKTATELEQEPALTNKTINEFNKL